MKESRGNILHAHCDALCVTTNGFIKRNGECVMGAGCAKQIAELDPTIPKALGTKIKANGNCTQVIPCNAPDVKLVAFPVKPRSVIYDGSNVVSHMTKDLRKGQTMAGWAAKAQTAIIERSAHELVALANKIRLEDGNTTSTGLWCR